MGTGGRRSARLPVWNSISEGAGAKKGDVAATAVCWGREGKKRREVSLWTANSNRGGADLQRPAAPVSTSNGGAAENRQTGPGWLCYKWAINSNWICSRKHINQTKAFITIGILKGKAISRHGGSCHGRGGWGGGSPAVLFSFSFLFILFREFVVLTFAARGSVLQVTPLNQ